MYLKQVSLVTSPSVEPVTVAEALNFCRVDNMGEVSVITNLISTAREVVELYTGRSLISTQWKLTLPNWEAGFSENYAQFFDNVNFGASRPVGVFSISPSARKNAMNVIYLDRSPLASIDAVKYYDPTETQITWDASNYYTLTNVYPGALALRPTSGWPDLYDRPDCVQISFTSGYGATSASVPANLKAAVLILTKNYYDGGREMVDVAQATKEIPLGVRHIMESRRVDGWIS